MTDRKWYETHDNLVGLAEWLNSEVYSFREPSDVIYFFEKPWKWTREYELWLVWRGAPNESVREMCVVAVDDNMTVAELMAELEEGQ